MPNPQPGPNGATSPSRYQPNPTDDRAVTGPLSSVYLALATAIEEITDNVYQSEAYRALDPGTRRAVRTADSALRRAAFSVVLHAPEPSVPVSIESEMHCHWCRHDRNVHNLYGCDEYTGAGGCSCPYALDGRRALVRPVDGSFQMTRGGPMMRYDADGLPVPAATQWVAQLVTARGQRIIQRQREEI